MLNCRSLWYYGILSTENKVAMNLVGPFMKRYFGKAFCEFHFCSQHLHGTRISRWPVSILDSMFNGTPWSHLTFVTQIWLRGRWVGYRPMDWVKMVIYWTHWTHALSTCSRHIFKVDRNRDRGRSSIWPRNLRVSRINPAIHWVSPWCAWCGRTFYWRSSNNCYGLHWLRRLIIGNKTWQKPANNYRPK